MHDVFSPSKRSGRLKVENQNIEKRLNFDRALSAIAPCLVKDDAASVGLLPHRHRP
jgi:hypothetical protein